MDMPCKQGVSVRVVAEASANQTWVTQLTTLKTAYDTLSDNEKSNSFIRTFDSVTKGLFNPGYLGSEGIYTRGATSGDIFQASLNLNAKTHYESHVNTSGVVTITNKSEVTNADKLQLCVYS